jgi:fructose-bisphosphate aldolase class I
MVILYRELLYGTPQLQEFLGGIIFYEDMLLESGTNGRRFADIVRASGLLLGGTADQGRTAIDESGLSGERVTLGLDSLEARLSWFKSLGVQFCKWRAEFRLGDGRPSESLISRNIHDLAIFAARSHEADLLPLVEPDLLIDGHHGINDCLIATASILERLFLELKTLKVDLSRVALKLHMITPGNRGPSVRSIDVARATVSLLTNAVPREVPLVLFLSGGQMEIEANLNLASICRLGATAVPQKLSFSFGRSLQRAALHTWRGLAENRVAAQLALRNSLEAASRSARGEE